MYSNTVSKIFHTRYICDIHTKAGFGKFYFNISRGLFSVGAMGARHPRFFDLVKVYPSVHPRFFFNFVYERHPRSRNLNEAPVHGWLALRA